MLHVCDNALKRRYTATTDRVENLRLRACGTDRMSDTRVANLMEVEERAGANKRLKKSHASRARKAHSAA